MSVFDHLQDVGSAKEELTNFIDRVLDGYKPGDQERTDLLKKIINLRNEFDILEEQFKQFS